MLTVAYTISQTLKESLNTIEGLRHHILVTPIAPKTELRIRWEAMLDRIYWSLLLSDNPLNKPAMTKLLTNEVPRKISTEQQDVVRYKAAHDYIREHWLASTKSVTPKTLQTLHSLGIGGGRMTASDAELKQFFDYLASTGEHPIIQAALAQLQVIASAPFTTGNRRLSRLLALLYLYKHGYDIRQFIVLCDAWRRNKVEMDEVVGTAIRSENVTRWLEFYAGSVVGKLKTLKQDIDQGKFKTDLPRVFWELNDRQKLVLTYLEQPGASITNRKLQTMARVSQITASRDLAKLVTLGLIFTHGKGRSVYYTKV